MKSKTAKKILQRKTKRERTISKTGLLSTGSTLLNLACSGKSVGGFAKGQYYFVVGDSKTGKTFLGLTCLAEATKDKTFKKHRLIFDDSENGALMNIKKFFGEHTYERIEPPALDQDGLPSFSSTIEEFYYNLDDAISKDQPFIYILDSMDSVSSEAEEKKFQTQKKAHRKGTQTTGSMGDGKAKKNASNIRRLLSHLRKTGSILIIVNQTRDNMTPMSFEKKTHSGGHALFFYACLVIWGSRKKKITKIVNDKKRHIGNISKIEVRKNRLTGAECVIDLPIYRKYGIDDVGSCVDYLVEEGHWKKLKQKIKAKGLEVELTRDKLIKYIEDHNLEIDLQCIVQDVWDKIEEACDVSRKKRYK